MTYQGGDVNARGYRLYCPAIAGEGVIGKILLLAEQVERFADVARETQRWGGDAAIADDQCGDTLTDLGRHVRLSDANQIVMGVDVNETRRHDQPRDFNDPIGGDIRQLADGDDGVVAH